MNKSNSAQNFVSQHQLLGHSGPIYALSLDQHYLYSAAADKLVVRWDLQTASQDHFVVKTERAAFSIFKSKLNQELIIGLDDGTLHIIDVIEKKELKNLKAHQVAVFAITENPLLAHRYTADADGNLFVWDLDWKLLLQLPLACGKIRQMQTTANGKQLLVARGDGQIQVFETEFFNELRCFQAHQDACTAICLSPDGLIISGGKDGHIRAWDTEGQKRFAFPAHKGTIYGLALLSDQVFVSVSRDKTIKIWELSTQKIIQKIEMSGRAHVHSINALLTYQNQFITAGDDKRIHVWISKVDLH
ncbi:MAG: hypothetical protein RLZZ65_903 [Bacteroidota bacterium]|jgi:WD40 repeat protein